MSLRRRIVVTSLLWLIAAAAYAYATVEAKLALPPGGDTYAHTVSFQVISFIAFKGPSLLCLLGVSMACAVFLARLRTSDLSARATVVMRATFWSLVGAAVAALPWAISRPVVDYNPYFWPAEQQVLGFMMTWLPGLAVVGALILAMEYRWLRQAAR